MARKTATASQDLPAQGEFNLDELSGGGGADMLNLDATSETLSQADYDKAAGQVGAAELHSAAGSKPNGKAPTAATDERFAKLEAELGSVKKTVVDVLEGVKAIHAMVKELDKVKITEAMINLSKKFDLVYSTVKEGLEGRSVTNSTTPSTPPKGQTLSAKVVEVVKFLKENPGLFTRGKVYNVKELGPFLQERKFPEHTPEEVQLAFRANQLDFLVYDAAADTVRLAG